MNTTELITWYEKLPQIKDKVSQLQNMKTVRELVRKDAKNQPIENDIIKVLSLLGEIKKRAVLSEECIKKSLRYCSDIVEYMAELEKRGVVVFQEEEEVVEDVVERGRPRGRPRGAYAELKG